jgi:protein-S-isoprenylcysteine O-methyltransferase Ste14
LYAYFRHPSYFGFFWWGIGTQVMLGNTLCLVAYAGVLWYFFMKRITRKYFMLAMAAAYVLIHDRRRETSD